MSKIVAHEVLAFLTALTLAKRNYRVEKLKGGLSCRILNEL